MTAILFSLILLAAPSTENGGPPPSRPLPDAPEGQVLDRMEWLTEDRQLALETELGRIRTEHHIDLFVVVWDRRLPDGETTETLATRLGAHWHREELWGTVLLTPGSISHPTVTCGGSNPALAPHFANAIAQSVTYGGKAWTDQGRLQDTALLLGTELIFAQQQISLQSEPAGGDAASSLTLSSTLPFHLEPQHFILGGIGAVLAFIILLAWFRSRPPKALLIAPDVHTFPTPQGHARLGAPWSGGSSSVVIVPPKPTP